MITQYRLSLSLREVAGLTEREKMKSLKDRISDVVHVGDVRFNKVVYSKNNNDYGITSYVTKNSRGYFVQLFDCDAMEYLPCGSTFPNLDMAKDYANYLVK